jgi:hypothetical protein
MGRRRGKQAASTDKFESRIQAALADVANGTHKNIVETDTQLSCSKEDIKKVFGGSLASKMTSERVLGCVSSWHRDLVGCG